jgi:hypothetical protein
MIFKWPTYPTKWRWRFALIPVYFGERRWLWMEFYQIRQTDPGSWERKRRDGAVVQLCIYY